MIYFIRHGESQANVNGTFSGRKDDSPLTEEGRQQARVTARKIKEQKDEHGRNLSFSRVITSPLQRAYETAKIVVEELGMNPVFIEIDERIAEYDMGELTGKPNIKIDSLGLISAPGAETVEQFRDRACECIKELSQSPGNILVAGHAGVGRILEAVREGSDLRLFYDLPAWPNASVTKLDWIHS